MREDGGEGGSSEPKPQGEESTPKPQENATPKPSQGKPVEISTPKPAYSDNEPQTRTETTSGTSNEETQGEEAKPADKPKGKERKGKTGKQAKLMKLFAELLAHIEAKTGVKIVRETDEQIRKSAEQAKGGKFRAYDANLLDSAILQKHARGEKIKPVDYYTVNDNMVVFCETRGGDIFTYRPLFLIEIDGNEDLINALESGINDNAITTAKGLSDAVSRLRNGRKRSGIMRSRSKNFRELRAILNGNDRPPRQNGEVSDAGERDSRDKLHSKQPGRIIYFKADALFPLAPKSEYSAVKVGENMPVPFAGNKKSIIEAHAELFARIGELAKSVGGKVIDAFAGAGTYTAGLGTLGALPKGSILNEWAVSRYVMHKMLAKNPQGVAEAMRALVRVRGRFNFISLRRILSVGMRRHAASFARVRNMASLRASRSNVWRRWLM